MENKYKEAFVEVLEILKNSNDTIKNKVSRNFINFLEKNKDKDYVAKIDFSNENWIDSLKQESLSVLALIYRDYLASAEEKEKLLVEEQEEFTRIEKELREKYSPDNIFKTHTKEIPSYSNATEENITDNNNSHSRALVNYKDTIFTKIKKWLKKNFNKKN